MDQAIYDKWWRLHLRSVRGEQLSDDERSSYELYQRELDREDAVRSDRLCQTRQAIAALEAENAQLQATRLALDQEIRRLETALDKKMRAALGVEG